MASKRNKQNNGKVCVNGGLGFYLLFDLAAFLMFSYLHLLLSFVKSSVFQERPEEHCSVREVESLHNSAHNVELEDCFTLYTKEEKVGC